MRGRSDLCSRVRWLLEAHFDGALAGNERDLVEGHLATCRACSHEYDQIGKVAAALASAAKSDPGCELALRISAAVATLPAPAAIRLAAGWRRLAAWAAGLAITLGLWRWLVPLMVSSGAANLFADGRIQQAGAAATARLEALRFGLHGLWVVVREASAALGLVAVKVTPVVGLYATAEVVVIGGIILLARRARRPRSVPLGVLL